MFADRRIRILGLGTALFLGTVMPGTAALAQQGVTLPSPAPMPGAPPATLAAPSPIPDAVPDQVPVKPVTPSPEEQAEYEKKRQEQLFLALDSTFRHQSRLTPPGVKPEEVGSLVLTVWEHMLLEEWRQGARTALPTPGEVQAHSAPTSIREISLGGIVWANNNDWTVWLNGQRVKPDALPSEIMDINVRRKYVELKWYDATTNLIYPVRLRPHQRFNLDSRIFLPGTMAN